MPDHLPLTGRWSGAGGHLVCFAAGASIAFGGFPFGGARAWAQSEASPGQTGAAAAAPDQPQTAPEDAVLPAPAVQSGESAGQVSAASGAGEVPQAKSGEQPADSAASGASATGAPGSGDAAAQSAPLPADAVSTAPVDESQFTLDMDPGLDVGVDWPDLNAPDKTDLSASPEVAPDGASEAGADKAGASSGELAPASTPTGTRSAEPGTDAAGTDVTGTDVAGDETAPATGQAAGGATPTSPEDGADAAPAMQDDGAEHRYAVTVTGLEDIADDQFYDRFDALSLLKQEDGRPANIAQISRRMREDTDLIGKILDAKGYYDALVRSAVRPPDDGSERLQVRFTVRPGSRYRLNRVALPGLTAATLHVPELASIFPVKAGDPVDADAIVAGRQALATALDEHGFPFSGVDEPVLTIDHDTQKGDLELVVRPGGYRLFGDILLDGESAKIFTARHLQRMARFERGDVYMASDIEDLRRAVVATGLVSSTSVSARDAGDGEHADVVVSTIRGPAHTVSGQIGYGTGEGYQIEGSWLHRNLFPPEGALTVSGLLGTKEQGGGLSFRRNNFPKRDHVLTGGLTYSYKNYDAYQAHTLELSGGLERQTNILFQKKWVWSTGVELIATRERNIYAGTTSYTTRDYLIAALPMSLTYDGSDNLLDPSRGFRLGARISPEVAQQGGMVYTYVKSQIDGSVYWPFSDRLVFASRMRLGSILGGVSSDSIAPSRRFYAGGGASVRGFAYQAIGPHDLDDNPVGGKSLSEFSIEARVRFGLLGVVPFIDAGNIATGFLPKMSDVRYGAGIGLRYYSTFGPIRIDVGTPINRRTGESRIAVYVSLGQAF